MSQPIQSEAHLTTFEAISMIVGNSIGTGIIAVPYLATKNSMLDVVWMVLIAYCVNVILHLIIAELSYNNGGVQLVKSFEGELFHGKMKQIFSWSVFIVYGLAIMIGVSGNINGGAQIFVNWFGMPFVAAQVLYYVIAGVVVFIGMKAVGIAQKYAVIVLMGIDRAEIRSHCPHGHCGSDDGGDFSASAEYIATGRVPLEQPVGAVQHGGICHFGQSGSDPGGERLGWQRETDPSFHFHRFWAFLSVCPDRNGHGSPGNQGSAGKRTGIHAVGREHRYLGNDPGRRIFPVCVTYHVLEQYSRPPRCGS